MATWKKVIVSGSSADLTTLTLDTQLAVAEGGTGVTTSTGTGAGVHAASPALTTPDLGTPSALVLTNATALPAAQVAQGTMASGMVLVAPALGTPASGTMTNVNGTSGITGLGTQTIDLEMGGFNIQTAGVITLKEQAEADSDVAGEGQLWVDTATPNVFYFTDDAGTDFRLNFSTSAQLRGMLSDETGTGGAVFATSPTLTTPDLGTPSALVLTNATALPAAQVSQGTMASGMVLVAPALGTPASGVATNLTGTASGLTAGTATVATTVTITDNEAEDENNAIVFVGDADADGGNVGLESDGTLTYNPGSGTVTATEFVGGGAGITGISAEIDGLDALSSVGNIHQTNDHFLISDAGTEKKITFSDLEDEIFGNFSGDITVAAGGAVTIGAGTVENSMLADDAVDSDELAAGSVDAAHLAADCVTAAKIGDNVINSEHYAAGSIDNEHLADDAVDSDELAAGAVDTAHLSADCVTAAKIGDNVIDSEHYAAGSIDNEHLADDAVGADELASNAVVNASIASSAAIDMDKLDGDSLASSLSDFAQDDLVILSDTSDSGNLKSMTTSNFEDAIFGNMSGDISVAAGGAVTLGSIEASHVTEISNLSAVEGAQLENINSVTISNTQWGYVGAFDQGLTTTSDVTFGDATLANIVVTGTASFHATTNLEVTDAFVLMRSGSSSTGDGGIVVQQDTQDTGSALGFDASAARWGVTSSFSADLAAMTPAAYFSMVVDIDASQPDEAYYKKNGNIKVNSGDIYIYS